MFFLLTAQSYQVEWPMHKLKYAVTEENMRQLKKICGNCKKAGLKI